MKVFNLYALLLALNLLCTIQVESEPVVNDNTTPPSLILWGYKLHKPTLTEIVSKREENKEFSDVLLIKIASKTTPNEKENITLGHIKSTGLLLLGYYKPEGSIDVIMKNLAHFDEVNKIWPSQVALACYGEDAVPVIIDAFENGLSGREAANAKAALAMIKGKNYREFVRTLRTSMSKKAFNEFIKYNTQ